MHADVDWLVLHARNTGMDLQQDATDVDRLQLFDFFWHAHLHMQCLLSSLRANDNNWYALAAHVDVGAGQMC